METWLIPTFPSAASLRWRVLEPSLCFTAICFNAGGSLGSHQHSCWGHDQVTERVVISSERGPFVPSLVVSSSSASGAAYLGGRDIKSGGKQTANL